MKRHSLNRPGMNRQGMNRQGMNRPTIRRTLAAAAAAGCVGATLFAATPPASADTVTVTDARDFSAGVADIRKVLVTNENDFFKVRVQFYELRKRAAAGATVYYDTDADGTPEWAMVSGLAEGTDYALVRTKGWRLTDRRSKCLYVSVRLDFAKDFMVTKVDRACVPPTDSFAAGVKAVDNSDADHPAVDWLGQRRSLSQAVLHSGS